MDGHKVGDGSLDHSLDSSLLLIAAQSFTQRSSRRKVESEAGQGPKIVKGAPVIRQKGGGDLLSSGTEGTLSLSQSLSLLSVNDVLSEPDCNLRPRSLPLSSSAPSSALLTLSVPTDPSANR